MKTVMGQEQGKSTYSDYPRNASIIGQIQETPIFFWARFMLLHILWWRMRVQKERDKEAEERRRQEECHIRGRHLKKTIAEKSPNMDSAWIQQEIKRKLEEKR